MSLINIHCHIQNVSHSPFNCFHLHFQTLSVLSAFSEKVPDFMPVTFSGEYCKMVTLLQPNRIETEKMGKVESQS